MKNHGNKKYWEKEAKRLHSLWIRQRDADVNGIVRCCTCNKPIEWRYCDCGHFMSRQFMSTYFHEKNSHGQCKLCNGPGGSGRQYEHGKFIDKKYGDGTADMLTALSKTISKLSWYDYYLIAEDFKQKLIDNGYQIR